MTVDTFQLQSSMLSEGSYDDETGTLTLVFQNGRIYEYEGVEPQVVAELKTAWSPGRFWQANIQGNY